MTRVTFPKLYNKKGYIPTHICKKFGVEVGLEFPLVLFVHVECVDGLFRTVAFRIYTDTERLSRNFIILETSEENIN